jgi:hypothetical protein
MDGRLECEIGGIAGDGPRVVKVVGEVDLATAPTSKPRCGRCSTMPRAVSTSTFGT